MKSQPQQASAGPNPPLSNFTPSQGQAPQGEKAELVPAPAFASAQMPPRDIPLAGASEPAVILHYGQELVHRLTASTGGSGFTSSKVIVDQATGNDVRTFPGDSPLHFGKIGERDYRPVLHSDGSYSVPLEPRYYREQVELNRGDEIVVRGEFTRGFQFTALSLVVHRQNGEQEVIRIPHQESGSISSYLDIKHSA